MTVKQTPLMQQYWDIKKEYAEALVFFQVGDFFELFFEDAKKASAFLGITLTKRGKDKGQDIPLCGVPVHALDHYLQKLIKGGFCVVLCEQLEQAVPGKIVKRAVTHVLTPGTLTETTLLNEAKASYLLAFVPHEDRWALLFAELMTAQLYATSLAAGAFKSLETELARFFPDEIILEQESKDTTFQTLFKKQGYFTSLIASEGETDGWIQKQFQEAVVDQLKANKSLEKALSAFYAYFKKNNQAALQEFSHIHFYQPEDFLVLDAASLKNLEIIKNNSDGSTENTLVSVVDHTCTAMGVRMLKKWLVRPLVNKKMIEQRLDVVQYVKAHYRLLLDFQEALKTVGDLERTIGRIALQRARLDDYLNLMQAVVVFNQLVKIPESSPLFFQAMATHLQGFSSLYALLESALNTDRTKDWLIKGGFDQHLDRLRELVLENHTALQALEKKEQTATGINSLKIRYNAIYGYYIEITNANANLVPAHYKRQQTLVGKERFMTQELQDLQQEILQAKNEISGTEAQVFSHVQQQVRPFLGALRKSAHVLAQLDVLVSFASCAYELGYTRPVFHEGRDIVVKQGKHPVVAKNVGSSFIPNDGLLTDEQSLWIITGPNMGGKSTFLRQMALIPLMAQCGSFVPAQSAQLPLLDAIFTRIGASDNLAKGKSTFLVEMEETAHICHYATEKSLVILDEVGRGTSTFDGIALAQSIIEYIHQTIRARCLFATHYHELTVLEAELPGIVNYHAASKQTEEGILFLHTMLPGSAQGSFGLSVAHLAHLPEKVISRAHALMSSFKNKVSHFPHVQE